MQLSTNITSLTALRQPTKLGGGQGGQKLVFIYPLLVDASLNKYTDLVRDFLSVEFVSQIKISNGLNITSKLSKLGTVGIGDNAINPAVEIRKSFNFQTPKNDNAKHDNDYELYKYQLFNVDLQIALYVALLCFVLINGRVTLKNYFGSFF